jgi:hypothetical protein
MLLMVTFTFFGAAAAYRANAHIAVGMLTDRLPAALRGGCCVTLDGRADARDLACVSWCGTAPSSAMETMGQNIARDALDACGAHLFAAAAGQFAITAWFSCWKKPCFRHPAPPRCGHALTMKRRVKFPQRLSDMDALVLLGSFAVLMLIGMPVAYALGMAALVGALWIDLPLDGVMIQIASGVNKFSLLAIPCFVLAGAIMAEGGMARRLVAFAGVLVGFVRGGLSLVNILASTFFGAISGSSVADTASIGSVLIPAMEKKGYPRDFSTAVTVSGSVQAILIPPSHNAVIYSMAAGGTVSVALRCSWRACSPACCWV